MHQTNHVLTFHWCDVFGHILEFLRDEGTPYDLSPDARHELRREAEYYGIDGLLEIIWNIRNSRS